MRNLHVLIALAKKALPLELLMTRLDYGHEYQKASCKSPFRDEKTPSWGLFRTKTGETKYRDVTTSESGDQIDFLMEHLQCDQKAAMDAFFSMAFPCGLPDEFASNGIGAKAAQNSRSKPQHHSRPQPPEPKPESSTELNPFNWAACVEALTPEEIQEFAKWRGYSVSLVEWLKSQSLIGIYQGHRATPVRFDGVEIGCQYRTEAGPRYANNTPGMQTPAELLVIGDPTFDYFFVLESQWDAFAFLERLGAHVGRDMNDICIAITRSASNFGKLQPLMAERAARAKEKDVVIIGQNDKPRPDKKPTGHDTLESGVRKICADNGLTLKVAFPPRPHKDLNDWVRTEPDADVFGMLEDAEASIKSRRSKRKSIELLDMKHQNDDNYLGDRMLAKSQPAAMLGQGGVGKSRIVLQLAICTILGRPFLGLETHAPRKKWLIVQTENSNRRLTMDLQGFVSGMGLTKEDLAILDECLLFHTIENETDTCVVMTEKEDYAEVLGLITGFNPDFVVFDPLYSFTNGDLNSDQDMKAVCDLILQATKRGNPNRVAIVLHHAGTGKAGAQRAIGFDKSSFGRNSKALFNWCRSQFNFARRDPDDNTKLIMVAGKNNNGKEFEPIGVVFNQEKHIYEIDSSFNLDEFKEAVADTPRGRGRPPGDDKLDEIAALITESSFPKWKLVDAIIKTRKVAKSKAYNLIRDAVDRGFISVFKLGNQQFFSPQEASSTNST